MDASDSSDEDEYSKSHKHLRRNSRHNKRRKTERREESSEEPPVAEVSFEPLLDEVEDLPDDEEELLQFDYGFDDVIAELLPEYIQARRDRLMEDAERDDFGVLLRRLTRAEISSIINTHTDQAVPLSIPEAIALRKLKVERVRQLFLWRVKFIMNGPGKFFFV
ncbi:hypothetical protein GYMLUDRAFT_560398 [Collybiopsis luxurians FD-317 M1]|uniref:Uncharacterized protein n=1 Tax=Collybiopsis luxurians FD-317 M1 TaxID=944289 RepID=A0A0D0CH41_9AGAR|nr:hypothetical protein GYMLUDRAFT_560398 [Collybiopsis luxurians FD-317 M1]